jgi:uncharacterized protein
MKSQRAPHNPFLLSGYHSPPYFCDRNDELDWLLDQVKNERNVVLHAERRVGKSALIHHLFFQLEKSKTAETVFVDLLGTTDFNSANERIGKAIIKKFGNLEKGLMPKMLKVISSIGATLSIDGSTGLPQVSFASNSQSASSHSLDIIGDFLKTHKRKIVISLDEFQEIATYPEKEAEALFRTWTQSYPMIRFIFSGSHQHLIQTMFTSKSRPFYKSAQLKSLGVIDSTEYTKFIRNHFNKKELSQEIINGILNWTLGQTYYVQVVCNKLYSSIDFDLKRLNFIFNELIEQEVPVFSTYQRLLTSFQWKLLVAIAKEEQIENPHSKAFIQTHNLGTPSSVSTALKKLINTELVIKKQGYAVQDVLLMRWLQKL